MRCWCSFLSGARYRLFAYGPADATVSQNPIICRFFKSRLILPFWYWLTQVVLEERPLNGCSSSSTISLLSVNASKSCMYMYKYKYVDCEYQYLIEGTETV